MLATKKDEMDEAFYYKSSELNESQERIENHELEIDTLKDLIQKLQVDLSG